MIALTDQEFQTISTYMQEHYGVNLEKKRFLIESKLRTELLRTNSGSFSAYWQQVQADSSRGLEQRMVDLLTTNYTYFCREEEPFRRLARALPGMERSNARQLAIWCTACASGQECYTLAMTLLDETAIGRLHIPFSILGTDISRSCLDTAKAGCYDAAEYARLPLRWRQRYCSPLTEGRFSVLPQVRHTISFQQQNLLEIQGERPRYHAIVCRNVMIYFRAETREKLINALEKRLLPGGYLIVGQTESLRRFNGGLDYLCPAVYQKKGEMP